MKTIAKATTFVLTMATIAAFCMPSLADPAPGQELKFQQLPMIDVPIPVPGANDIHYYGHDELSSAWSFPPDLGQDGYRGKFMADDFADEVDTAVFHVRWWGSYLQKPDGIPSDRVKKFLIAFETDVPADPTNPDSFSHPGTVLSTEIVTIDYPAVGDPVAPGTFTEKSVHPGGDPLNEELFVYNAELKNPFPQKSDTIYWLKIVALDDFHHDPGDPGALSWGWHNRDYTVTNPYASSAITNPGEFVSPLDPLDPDGTQVWHFQDDAVSGDVLINMDLAAGQLDLFQSNMKDEYYVPGWDGPGPIDLHSKDLAFELYTVPIPEPSTLTLVAVGMLAFAGWGRRRRHSRS